MTIKHFHDVCNIVGKTKVHPDYVIDGVPRGMLNIVVMGITAEGDFYIASSDPAQAALVLMQRAVAEIEGRMN